MERPEDEKKDCVKAYLSYVRAIEENLSQVFENIERLKSSLTLSGLNYSEKIGRTTPKDTMSSGVIRLIEMQDKTRADYAEMLDAYTHAQKLCLTCPEHEALSVLWEHYVKYKSFKVIANARGVSVRQIHRLSKIGIPLLYERMPDGFK